MLSFLNKKLKFLLIVILAVIGISFIFFGSWTPHGPSGGTDVLAKIDGKNIKVKDFISEVHTTRVIYTLQTGQLAPDSTQADNVFRMQTWNRLLVLAAAKKNGTQISEDQAENYIIHHPLFQDKDGKYSDLAFNTFFDRILQPQGIDKKRFINIVREKLAYDQTIQDIASTAVVQPAEIQETIDQLYSKVSLQYVEVSEEAIRKGLKPTDAELQTFFNANSAEYAVPETRQIEYVKFQLDPKQAALKDDERNAALRELGKKAYEFTNAFFSSADAKQALPDFAETAKKAGLQVVAVAPFTKADSIIEKTPNPHLTTLAFNLSAETPVSDSLPVADGFIVLHLLKVTPSQPKSFEEARADVLKKYTDYLVATRLLEQAKAVAVNLRSSLAEGKNWQQAATAQGLKVQTLPDIVPAEAKPDAKNPLVERAAYVAGQLPLGKVSDPVRSPAGAAIFYAVNRVKPNAEQIAKVEKDVRAQMEQMRRQQVVGDWLNSLLTSPKTSISQEALTGSANRRS